MNYTQKYCVCIVDIVNSTLAAAGMTNSQKIRKYYSIFLNTISLIIKGYGGKVTKNVGDSLIYYFAKTTDSSNKLAFLDMLECCMTILGVNSIINKRLDEEDLPHISYRISADYGAVELATSATSSNVDIFGSIVNTCAKINELATPNGMVIGQDLYCLLSMHNIHENYSFTEINRFHDESNKSQLPFKAYSVNSSKISEPKIQSSSIHQKIEDHLEHQQQIQSDSCNILLVDDDKDILLTFKEVLEVEGYNVKLFSDPKDALEHFLLTDPYYYHLVLMDIRMPCLNGIQLYLKVKAISPDTKVLFITALDAVDELVSILPEVEANDIMRKPVESKHFLSEVRAALRIQTQRPTGDYYMHH
ncbi:MAG TPA: response regulator [Nitrososphaeraceae archaeon]|nr:response regulator [Nitrososphaeraceae archaeon]